MATTDPGCLCHARLTNWWIMPPTAVTAGLGGGLPLAVRRRQHGPRLAGPPPHN